MRPRVGVGALAAGQAGPCSGSDLVGPREGVAWLGWCFVLGRKAFLFHSPISCPFLFLISILLYAMG